MLRSALALPVSLVLLKSAPAAAGGVLDAIAAVAGGVGVPEGTTLRTVADPKHLGVSSPTALAFDEDGRIFVAETHRFGHGVEDDRAHTYWYLDDLAARSTADRRALHEKWKDKYPLERMTEKSELLRLLVDTDGDGTPDESNVFADGFNDVLDGTLAGVMPYEGTVFVACIPKLLALRDTDGDGKADERNTLVEGFGVRISLSGHDLNGFALGPDGRIYGTIGDRGFVVTTPEGKKLEYPNEGAVFRFEADGSGFEIVHRGLRNPKEIAFDELGYAFTVDNNSDQGDAARVVYVVEGGDSGWEMEHQAMHTFHRQIGLENRPPNRWMDERMWELANDDQPAHILPPVAHLTSGPSGLTYHPGVGFIESEAGRFLVCDYRGGAANSGIWSFGTEPDGAGMKLVAPRKIVSGIAATDAEFSSDGRLFVTDFGGGWVSHPGGRLVEIDAGENTWRAKEADSAAAIMREGFSERGPAELLTLLRHPDVRIRIRAHIELTRRPESVKRLTEATKSSERMVRIHGIQALGIVARCGSAPSPGGGFRDIPSITDRRKAEEVLMELTSDPDEEIRCQALRALLDATVEPGPLQLGPLFVDASPRVRFFATLLAGKRKDERLFGLVCEMLKKNDNRDPYLRHAGAYALQHLVPSSDALRSLAGYDSVAVRIAAVVALRRMRDPMLATFLNDRDDRVVDEAIRAVCDLGMDAQRKSVARWMDDLDVREWSPMMLRRLLHNSFFIGDEENAKRVLDFATGKKRPVALRVEALRLIAGWAEPFPVDQFTGHWRPMEKRDTPWMAELIRGRLPKLLARDGPVLAATLEAVDRYQVSSDELGEDRLRDFVSDKDASAEVRAKALEILVKRKPDDLPGLLDTLTRDTPDEVTAAALEALVRISPQRALAPLKEALDPSRPELAQRVWPLVARIEGPEADRIIAAGVEKLTEAEGIAPWAIELLGAASSRESDEVAKALKAYGKRIDSLDDPLAAWNVSLQGGDAENGKALFTTHPAAECMRCHKVGGGHDLGGATAPDLAGVARRHKDRRSLLESMVLPNKAIAPGFGAVVIELANGASLGGNLVSSTDDHIDVESDGKLLRIRRPDVKSVTKPTSPMPSMAEILSRSELRDLVAYLATLDEAPEATGPAREPVVVDPDSLLESEPTAGAAPAGVDPADMKSGKTQFIVCAACHGQNGEGTAAGPPLAGSEWVVGPAENLIRIQLRGLRGPIEVKGTTYDFPAGMAALAYQNDQQIAAVLTYIRNSFGNSAPPVTAAEVAALRSEVGKPQLTAADLVPPDRAAAPADEKPSAPSAGKYDDLRTGPAVPKWVILLGGVLAVSILTWLQIKRSKPPAP